jgi:hypothetical protein
VALRLIFDDARYPDFEIALWMPGDEAKRNAPSPAEAIQEANRWIARVEAILRRASPPRPPTPPTQAAPPPMPQTAQPIAPPPAPLAQAEADLPPWDETPVRPAARPSPRRAEPRTRDLFDDDPDDGFT